MSDNPEAPEHKSDQEATKDLLRGFLEEQEWHQLGPKQISWLGNGTIKEGTGLLYFPAYDSPLLSESKTTRYRRHQPVEEVQHQFEVIWEVGQDSEGRTCALRTIYTVDLLDGSLKIAQGKGQNWKPEYADKYPHYDIQTKPPEEQWSQLKELLQEWHDKTESGSQ